jgi:Fic family protein
MSGLRGSSSTRAGRFVAQPSGFSAFVPAALPPDPPVALADRLLSVLSAADLALGRLDGIVRVVPDPELFVAMYVRREAVLSSQIEGTQSTLEDLLESSWSPSGPAGSAMSARSSTTSVRCATVWSG